MNHPTLAAAALGVCLLCSGAAASPTPSVDVRHVAIDLRFDWNARQAIGTAALTLQPRHATAQVALDAGMLAIDEVLLVDGSSHRALKFAYDGGDKDGGLAITLDRRYAVDEKFVIRIAYRTLWKDQSDPQNLWGSHGRGIRVFGPTTTDARKRRQAWSGGLPGANRYWFPGIDAPGSMRSSRFSATVETPLTVVASGSLETVTNNADGTRTFVWQQPVPHANMRTAFVVGEFIDIEQRSADGTPLHNFGYPDERQATADSVVLLPDMVGFFSTLTGARFPFASYSQVFVQDLPWGHFGAGIAVQTENMVDDHGTHADFLYLWDGLQAEALAAQWFGGSLAACDWRHAWLERGFAHHLAGLYAEKQNGRDEHLLWYVQGDHGTLLADWAGGQRPALVPQAVDEPAAFVFSNAPWARGAAVLHMLRRQLGDATWAQVLRHHVRANTGKAVCSDGFRASLEAVTGQPWGWFFDQWVYRAGHPVFEVGRHFDAAAGQLILSVRQTQGGGWFAGPVEIDIDGRIERVSLQAVPENRFSFTVPGEPKLVHFDVEGTWIKEMKFDKGAAELLHQLRSTRDTLGRQWAMGELARLVKAPAAAPTLKADFEAALREVVGNRQHYWRVRFNALTQLRTLLAPTAGPVQPSTTSYPVEPVRLDPATRMALLAVVGEDGGTWIRAAAIRVLGASRDPALAPLYVAHLRDKSDRVINAAAIALGASGSLLAFDALAALPAHPSWKHQSLISALAGLKELRDPRGASIARAALSDVRSPRWTLSTPVWDYRLAAAETLAALGEGASARSLVHGHFERALVEDDTNDIFSNLVLMVALGDATAKPLMARLRQRFAGDANALKAVDGFEAQLDAALKPTTAR